MQLEVQGRVLPFWKPLLSKVPDCHGCCRALNVYQAITVSRLMHTTVHAGLLIHIYAGYGTIWMNLHNYFKIDVCLYFRRRVPSLRSRDLVISILSIQYFFSPTAFNSHEGYHSALIRNLIKLKGTAKLTVCRVNRYASRIINVFCLKS